MIHAPQGLKLKLRYNGGPEFESFYRGPCDFEWQGDVLVIVAATELRMSDGEWMRRVHSINRKNWSIVDFVILELAPVQVIP